MFVKPASSAVKVRDPITKLHIPAEGKEVPDGDTYWTRRILDGDVVLATPDMVSVGQIPDSTSPEKE
jgi:hypothetical protein